MCYGCRLLSPALNVLSGDKSLPFGSAGEDGGAYLERLKLFYIEFLQLLRACGATRPGCESLLSIGRTEKSQSVTAKYTCFSSGRPGHCPQRALVPKERTSVCLSKPDGDFFFNLNLTHRAAVCHVRIVSSSKLRHDAATQC